MVAKHKAGEKPAQQTFNVTARVTVDVTVPVTASDFGDAADVAGGLEVEDFLTTAGEIEENEGAVRVRGIWLSDDEGAE